MNKKHRVIFSCDLSRGLGGADNTFDDVGVIQILDDDAKTGDEVEDAAEFLGNDEVGSGSQVLDPLRELIGDLIDLQPKLIINGGIAKVRRREERCLNVDE